MNLVAGEYGWVRPFAGVVVGDGPVADAWGEYLLTCSSVVEDRWPEVDLLGVIIFIR